MPDYAMPAVSLFSRGFLRCAMPFTPHIAAEVSYAEMPTPATLSFLFFASVFALPARRIAIALRLRDYRCW